MRFLRFAVMLSCCSLCWVGSDRAFAEETGGLPTADIELDSWVLEHHVEDTVAESLVRITAVNHGPADVSSYLVATCLSDPLPIEVDGEIPGGCGSFGLVAPCSEFGLGFRFGALAEGQTFQCLVRVRAPLAGPPIHLTLSASHPVDADGAGVLDPDATNDSIVLSASGVPNSNVPVPGLPVAGMLALAGLLAELVRRHLPDRGRAH